MTDLDPTSRAAWLPIQTTCLAISASLILRFEELMSGADSGSISKTEIEAIVRPHFPQPLTALRSEALARVVVGVLNEHGITRCAQWELAHLIDHVLYEEDASEIRKAMSD